MFHANNKIAARYFPDVYNSYFKEYILLYENMESTFLKKCEYRLLEFKNTYKEIGELIEFYELNIKIDDWAEGSETLKEKLFGKFLNKLIGPIYISPTNCNKLFNSICSLCNKENQKYSLYAVGNLIIKLTLKSILKKFDQQYYIEKRKTKITKLLSDQYLAYITSNLLD